MPPRIDVPTAKSRNVSSSQIPTQSSSSTSGRNQRLVLMGSRKAGKSSIAAVVFHKTPPAETLYTESTTEITQDGIRSFMNFDLTELPGNFDIQAPDQGSGIENVFQEGGAIIWVIDAQDQYLEALSGLMYTITYLHQKRRKMNIEVFVHKIDGLSEEFKNDIYRDIRQRVQDELSDLGYDSCPVSFHQTSIYDHSVFESVSNVVQKLIPQLSTLESLLNSLCSTCRMQKAYLFDVPSKIFLATDSSPRDSGSYETCSDMIDVIVDISELYGWDRGKSSKYTPDEKIDVETIDHGNDATESLITMERRGYSYLYAKEMHRFLALVCIIGGDNAMGSKAIIDYNVARFRDALGKVWQW